MEGGWGDGKVGEVGGGERKHVYGLMIDYLHTSVFEPLINDYRHNTTKHASAYGIDNIT